MDSYERRHQYIELMRASLRAAASGDAEKVIEICGEIENLALETIRAANECKEATEKKLLLEVVEDAVSFLSRKAHEVGLYGPNKVEHALHSAVERIVAARKRVLS